MLSIAYSADHSWCHEVFSDVLVVPALMKWILNLLVLVSLVFLLQLSEQKEQINTFLLGTLSTGAVYAVLTDLKHYSLLSLFVQPEICEVVQLFFVFGSLI
eukprot:snap_masked-scaffold_7-processed-gene-18.32-mRNA-1 protein AED:1.00 eAED:1.00 QI:0/-1/0/0/-1/1/1/0/100